MITSLSSSTAADIITLAASALEPSSGSRKHTNHQKGHFFFVDDEEEHEVESTVHWRDQNCLGCKVPEVKLDITTKPIESF